MPQGRIDVHAHYFGGSVEALLSSSARPGVGPGRSAWTPQAALALMDHHGIAVQILSLPFTPVSTGADEESAAMFARQVNGEYAGLIREYPGRFGAFAALPGDNTEAMLAEISYAIDILHLDGVALTSNIEGHYFGSPFFEPVLAELNNQRIPVLVHPTDCPHALDLALGRPRSLIEFPFDTARNITNAVYSGVFKRYPYLKLIIPHAGGPLPTLAWRIGVNTTIGRGPNDASITPEHVHQALAGLYYDTAMAGSRNSLLPLLEVTDTDHLMLGTDSPAAPAWMVAENLDLLASFGFTATQINNIEQGNALRLFPRLDAQP